jgi:hypothetical protein
MPKVTRVSATVLFNYRDVIQVHAERIGSGDAFTLPFILQA